MVHPWPPCQWWGGHLYTVSVGESDYTYYESAKDAEEAGVVFNPDWRSACAGEYVLADTGHIIPVIAVFSSETYNIIRTPGSTVGTNPGARLSHEVAEDRCKLGGKKTRYDDPARRLTVRERDFVRALFTNGFNVEVAYDLISKSKRGTRAFDRGQRHMARRANVEKAIMEQTGEMLDRLGFTKEWVITKYAQLAEDAKSEAVVKGVIDRIAEMQGMIRQKDGVNHQPGRAIFTGFNLDAQNKLKAENEKRTIGSGSDQSICGADAAGIGVYS